MNDLIINAVATIFVCISYFPIAVGLTWLDGMTTDYAIVTATIISLFILVGIWL